MCAVLRDAVDVHLRGADHEIHMVEADVSAALDEFLVGEFLASREGKAVGATDGDMAGCVLVKERIVKEVSALRDGGAGRDEGHFPKPMRTFVCVHQLLQRGFTLLCGDFCDASILECYFKIFN